MIAGNNVVSLSLVWCAGCVTLCLHADEHEMIGPAAKTLLCRPTCCSRLQASFPAKTAHSASNRSLVPESYEDCHTAQESTEPEAAIHLLQTLSYKVENNTCAQLCWTCSAAPSRHPSIWQQIELGISCDRNKTAVKGDHGTANQESSICAMPTEPVETA